MVCVGETMAALAPDPLGPLDGADLLRVDIAGAESNVALYLADHGIPARWVSAVGDDPFGRRVRARIAAGGVDVSGVRTDPQRPTGLLLKDPGPRGHGTRVHYHRVGSAASALTPDVLDDPAVAGAALVHLSGITPALSPGCRALVERALRPDRPWPVSFDVNHRPALWDGRSQRTCCGGWQTRPTSCSSASTRPRPCGGTGSPTPNGSAISSPARASSS